MQPFSSAQDGHGTNLHDPLAEAPEKFKNLVGVVLASDGDWNEGQKPAAAASQLRLKGTPVFAVPVGATTRLPDVELLNVDAPTFGVVGKAVRIPFSIDSSLPREFQTTVVLKASNGDTVEKDIRIAPMGRTNDLIVWKPKETGDLTVSLEVPKPSQDSRTDNKKISAPIAIREEKLRVLIVESYPRWEYRYLRNALSRDPGVSLSCLLFHPGLNKVGGGNKDYIKEFPKGLDQLAEYDVVFLGDVGQEEGQLTAEQCRLLKGLVEFQASGLVFMPGLDGRENSLLQTELGELYPVVMDDTAARRLGFAVTQSLRAHRTGPSQPAHKIGRFAGREFGSLGIACRGFNGMPRFSAPRRAPKYCASTRTQSNDFGRLPLLVTRTYGVGKVLFMGTDGAWRWRKGVEDKYHYRFWGQVVRWMAYQRNMAKGETMRLYYSPDQPQLQQTVTLNANVMENRRRASDQRRRDRPNCRPLRQNRNHSALPPFGDEWGAFAGHLHFRRARKTSSNA